MAGTHAFCGRQPILAEGGELLGPQYEKIYTGSLADAEKNNLALFKKVFFETGDAERLITKPKSMPLRFVHYALPWLSYDGNAFPVTQQLTGDRQPVGQTGGTVISIWYAA